MESHSAIQLHFDFVSCRALLCCDGKEYVLPDTYPNKDAARTAAQKFVWEKLGMKRRDERVRHPSDLTVWLR